MSADASPLAYRLITGPDDRSFCERISTALAEGYVLHGGPAVTFNGNSVICAQAVILPHCVIGRGARLSKVVVDRGVVIPDGLVVGEDPVLDAQRFRRTDNGVVLVTKSMIDRLTE